MKKQATTISVTELMDMFSTERKAVKWLEKKIWKKGKPTCPRCGGTSRIKKYAPRKHAYYCNPCRRAFTVKSCSVLFSSNLPPQTWAIALYTILTARKGISSLQLSKELGITQKTAWLMLHKIREAGRQGAFMLEGVVEADETYIGGKELTK